MASMKTITIDGVTYEIQDDASRTRLDAAENDIQLLNANKAEADDIPANISDLNDDVGILTEVPVEDVKIDGESIVTDKYATIPRASGSTAGVIKFDPSTGNNTNYADIYASEQTPSRVPTLDSNNLITADQLPAATTSTKGAMSAEDKTKLNGIFTLVYPVGSIYMSVNDTDPGSIFGGTWERIEDRFLLAASSTYAAGATGGSADAIVPTHNHYIQGLTVSGTTESSGLHSHSIPGVGTTNIYIDKGVGFAVVRSGGTNVTANNNGSHTHAFSGSVSNGYTDNQGENAIGKNMPPYLAVYVWKRTA